MNQAETARVLTILTEIWDTKEVTPTIIAIWQKALEDLEYPDVEEATLAWIGNERWFPKPGELRERIQPRAAGMDLQGVPPPSYWAMCRRWGEMRRRWQDGEVLTDGERDECDRLERRLGVPSSGRVAHLPARVALPEPRVVIAEGA